MSILPATWVNPNQGQVIARFDGDVVALQWSNGLFGFYALDLDAFNDGVEAYAMHIDDRFHSVAPGKDAGITAGEIFFAGHDQ
jgi:hypothetical protein